MSGVRRSEPFSGFRFFFSISGLEGFTRVGLSGFQVFGFQSFGFQTPSFQTPQDENSQLNNRGRILQL